MTEEFYGDDFFEDLANPGEEEKTGVELEAPIGDHERQEEDGEEDEGVETLEDELDGSLQEIITDFMSNGVLLKGEGKEYDATTEGFRSLIEDTIQKRLASEVSKYPKEIQDFISQRDKIGVLSLKDFLESQEEEDYTVADPNNAEHAVLLMEDYLYSLGYSKEEVADEINSLMDRNVLTTRAVKAKESLIKEQENNRALREERLKQEHQERQEALETKKREFKDKILTANRVKGFDLGTVEQRTALFEYATKPVGRNGETQAMLDADEDDDLLFLYIKKNKLSFESLNKKAVTNATKEVRAKLGAITTTGSQKGGQSRRTKGTETDFDLY